MNRFGIDVKLKNIPALDPDFLHQMRAGYYASITRF